MTGWALLAGAAFFLAGHLATIVLYLVRIARPAPKTGSIGTPAITLLRPICGADRFDEETLGSSFLQDYPAYDIIFCAPSEDDPAAALARRLIAAHPEVPAQLLTGLEHRTGNPKLDNLWKGWAAAKAEWVCMSDSNLLLPPDYLKTVVSMWDEGTGLVSSPPWGARPEGLAGRLECAFLNSNQARLQFAADSLGIGFAQGKTLFWNRAMLTEAGGLQVLGETLAEDVAATKLVHRLGRHVRLTPRPFAQPIGRRRFWQVWDRQLRWSRVRRDGFPLFFLAEIVNGALLPSLLLAAAIAITHLPWAVLPAFWALWYGAEYVLTERAKWPHGWMDVLAMLLRDLLLPVLWGATFLKRSINWRGNEMTHRTEKRTEASSAITEKLPR